MADLTPEPMEPILADRSTLERVANCPYSQWLYDLIEGIVAEYREVPLTSQQERAIDSAPSGLCERIRRSVEEGHDLLAVQGQLVEGGTEGHRVIEEAFKYCGGDLEQIPSFIEEELPKTRPDIQPHVIRAARHIARELADLHVRVLGVEIQIDHVLIPEIPGTRGAVVLTVCLDLLAEGLGKSLHVYDWKMGWKKRSKQEAFDSFQAEDIAYILWQQPAYTEVDVIHFWFIESMHGTKTYTKFERDGMHSALPHLTQELAFNGRIMQALRLWQTGCTDAWPEEKKCEWCDVIQFCKHANTRAIDITSDPAAFVDRMIVLKQLLAKDKKTATAYIKKYDKIVGTVGVFEKTPPSTKFLTQVRLRKEGETNIEIEPKSKEKEA